MARCPKRVLIVEDEPAIRQLLVKLLESKGYAVDEAAAGEAGLEIARKQRNDLWMVITDIVMPGGMDGLALGAILEDEIPELPVLYITGYDLPEIDLLPSVLKKPFTTEDLFAKMESAAALAQEV